jgi:hypothetical protein
LPTLAETPFFLSKYFAKQPEYLVHFSDIPNIVHFIVVLMKVDN